MNFEDQGEEQEPRSKQSRGPFLNLLLGGSLVAFASSVIYPILL